MNDNDTASRFSQFHQRRASSAQGLDAASGGRKWRYSSFLSAALLAVACQGELPLDKAEGPSTAMSSTLQPLFAQAQCYSVELNTHLAAANESDQVEPAQGFDLSGAWCLHPTASPKAEDGAWVHAQLTLERLQFKAEENSVVDAQTQNDYARTQLQRPLLLRFNPSGGVEALKAPNDLGSVALGALKSLAAQLQVSTPAQPGATRWRTTEFDTMGAYPADYERPTSTKLVRKKPEYERMAKQGRLEAPGKDAPLAINSEQNFTLDELGRVAALSSLENIRFPARELWPELRSETRITARRMAEPPSLTPSPSLASLQALPVRAFHARTPAAGMRFEMDIVKVGELRSIDDALARLRDLESQVDAQANADRRRVEMGLSALIRVSEEAEKEAWQRALAQDPERNRLLVALAESPRPQMQQNIVELLADPKALPLAQRVELLDAVAHNPAPSLALLKALGDLRQAPILGDDALLAIGALAHGAQQADLSVAEAAYAVLETALTQAENSNDPDQVALGLRALGNSGHPNVPARIQPALTSDSATLRAAAVRAFRKLEDPAVDAEIERIASQDSARLVQLAVKAVQQERQQRTLGRIR